MVEGRNIALGAILALAPTAALAGPCNTANDGYELVWNSNAWGPAGTTTYSANIFRDGTLDEDPIQVDLSLATLTATFAASSPASNATLSGGDTPVSDALYINATLDDPSSSVTTTITFDKPVANASFRIFDIDGDAINVSDGIRVTAQNTVTASGEVSPAMTTPYGAIDGNNAPSTVYLDSINSRADGRDVSAADTDDFGNVTFTFSEDIDEITIVFDGNPSYSAKPGGIDQDIAISDISFCSPRPIKLDVNKTASIFSESGLMCEVIPGTPEENSEVAIPGACIEYYISVSNTSDEQATDISFGDNLPANLVYIAAQHAGFTATDPGFSFSTPIPATDCSLESCVVSIQKAIIEPGGFAEVIVRGYLQ